MDKPNYKISIEHRTDHLGDYFEVLVCDTHQTLSNHSYRSEFTTFGICRAAYGVSNNIIDDNVIKLVSSSIKYLTKKKDNNKMILDKSFLLELKKLFSELEIN